MKHIIPLCLIISLFFILNSCSKYKPEFFILKEIETSTINEEQISFSVMDSITEKLLVFSDSLQNFQFNGKKNEFDEFHMIDFLVYSNTIAEANFNIDITNQPNGAYFIHINNSDSIGFQKMVKQ